MKKIAIIVALLMVVAMSATSYAEVQNVKVGGDIVSRFRVGNDLDLDSGNPAPAIDPDVHLSDTDSWWETRVRLTVQADLTDNVMAMVRLIADWVWDIDQDENIIAATEDNMDVQIDLAYLQLSEFWFSYLTMIIGRQELHYGNDLIIGQNKGNINNVQTAAATAQTLPMERVPDAFNAVRNILDFDPLTIDIIMAVIEEERLAIAPGGSGDDEVLYGINANYVFSNDWVGELYLFLKDQGNIDVASGGHLNELTQRLQDDTNVGRDIFTVGGRAEGAIYPVSEALYFGGEIAYQFGDYNDQRNVDTIGTNPAYANNGISALAAQISLDYTWDNEYQPNFGLQYTYFEGNEYNDITGDYTGWDPMYENQEQGIIYDVVAGGPNMGAASNAHIINAFLSLQATEQITIAVDYYHFWLDEELNNSDTVDAANDFYQTDSGYFYAFTNETDMGDEIDVDIIYDYTEDVQFRLRGAWFIPGDAYANVNDDDALYFEYGVSVAF